jgi:glycosyl hydrolase family 26
MRRLSLNLLTSSATILLLGALTVPAIRIVAAPEESQGTVTQGTNASRAFGVYVDPWHVDDWARKIGAAPQLVAKFQAFSRRPTIDRFLNEAERRGMRRVMVSWEPWRPVPAALGLRAQQRPQPGYRNADIAAGARDSYVRDVAVSLRKFRGVVYLRYAHEMNGFWYPWSHDARSFVRAWRRIVRIFGDARAGNVRFVWSVNPNLYEPRGERVRNMYRYWPGSRYVDFVGSTMINFGGQKTYSVARLYGALQTLRAEFRKPVVLTETNTAHAGRVRWLQDLRLMLAKARWIRAVVWSQLPSRGKVQRGNQVGDTDWDVTADPDAAEALRRIIQDGPG